MRAYVFLEGKRSRGEENRWRREERQGMKRLTPSPINYLLS